MRIAATIFLIVFMGSPALAEDRFVGVFESESRENFGSSTPGEYRINIEPISAGKYMATMYHRETELWKQALITCPIESEAYLNRRPPGPAEVLCTEPKYGKPYGFISYAENGISVRAVKPKYAKNPELVKQEGLKPGDPALFELRHHKAKYYAHVTWFFYGFRKVGS